MEKNNFVKTLSYSSILMLIITWQQTYALDVSQGLFKSLFIPIPSLVQYFVAAIVFTFGVSLSSKKSLLSFISFTGIGFILLMVVTGGYAFAALDNLIIFGLILFTVYTLGLSVRYLKDYITSPLVRAIIMTVPYCLFLFTFIVTFISAQSLTGCSLIKTITFFHQSDDSGYNPENNCKMHNGIKAEEVIPGYDWHDCVYKDLQGASYSCISRLFDYFNINSKEKAVRYCSEPNYPGKWNEGDSDMYDIENGTDKCLYMYSVYKQDATVCANLKGVDIQNACKCVRDQKNSEHVWSVGGNVDWSNCKYWNEAMSRLSQTY